MSEVDVSEPVKEHMVPQSEVDKLVVATKRETAEKFKREADNQARSQTEKAVVSESAPVNSGMGGMQMYDSKKIRDEVLGEIRGEFESKQKQYDEQTKREKAEEFVAEYEGKLAVGKDRYEDFDDVVSTVDPNEFVDVIMLANESEGTADIMYELAKNPQKLIQVATAARMSKSQAKRIMNEIAQSMKLNRNAVDGKPTTNQPLPRSKASTAGTSSGDLKTIADFRGASFLRGQLTGHQYST